MNWRGASAPGEEGGGGRAWKRQRLWATTIPFPSLQDATFRFFVSAAFAPRSSSPSSDANYIEGSSQRGIKQRQYLVFCACVLLNRFAPVPAATKKEVRTYIDSRQTKKKFPATIGVFVVRPSAVVGDTTWVSPSPPLLSPPPPPTPAGASRRTRRHSSYCGPSFWPPPPGTR